VIDAVSSVLRAMSRHAVWHFEDLRCHRINEPGKCNTGSVLSLWSGSKCALGLLACSSRANACLRRQEEGQRSDAEGNVTDRKRKKIKIIGESGCNEKVERLNGIDSEFDLHSSHAMHVLELEAWASWAVAYGIVGNSADRDMFWAEFPGVDATTTS
jgi:hypothetical protein